MKNSFSLQQISRTGNPDSILISRQNKLNLLADFMPVKYENPRMKQSEIANQLDYSTSTLQRYRNDINMLSPYRIQPNNTNKQQKETSNTNSNKDLQRDPDLKRPQMTSNDLKRPQSTSNENVTSSKNKKKNIGKAGCVHNNVEINEHYLDEILQNNNTWTLICVIKALYSFSYTSMVLVLCKRVCVRLW